MENLNAEQVKKALECCIKAECWGDCQELGCPASTKNGCHFYLRTDDDNENALYIEMLKDALALINSQEQKIGELTKENEGLTACNKILVNNNAALEFELAHTYDSLEDVKAETVRKMRSEIEKRCIKVGIYPVIVKNTINQIAKEMLEGG